MGRIEPYCPLSRGVPRVHDRRIVSDTIFVVHNGLRWHSAPAGYGTPKTISRSSIGRSGADVFTLILPALTCTGQQSDWLLIAAPDLQTTHNPKQHLRASPQTHIMTTA